MPTLLITLVIAVAIGCILYKVAPAGDTFDRIKGLKKAHADLENFTTWVKTQISAFVIKRATKTNKKVGELIDHEVTTILAGAKALEEKAQKILEVEHPNVPVATLKRVSSNLQKITV